MPVLERQQKNGVELSQLVFHMALFHCVVRHGSEWHARLSSARFVFPLQFSTALEWAGLFTCRYSCAASTAVTPEKRFHSAMLHQALAGSAPRLSTRGQSVLPQITKERCAHSKQLRSSRSFADCADLNPAGLLCLVPQVDDNFLRPISDQQSLHVTFW